jgi:hypothetical protein
MSRPRFPIVAVAAALLLAAAAAPAQRPEPLTGGFDPEDVLVNLEQRVKERDWKRYGEFLAPDFRFVPDSGVPLEYPAVDWDAWGRRQEIRFARELVSPGHDAALNLRDKVLERGRESEGRAEWDLVYTLTSRGQVFRSRAILVFVRVEGLWFLREWIDTTVETDPETGSFLPTSGSLRGALSR